MAECVDVGDDRHVGVARLGCRDCRPQAITRRGHERSMEGARHRQRHHALRAEFFRVTAGLLDAARRARNHHLPWRIEVGDPHLVVGAPARNFNEIVVEAEHRRHRTWRLETCLVHCVTTFEHEAHTVVIAECTVGGEGGVLAEAVARAETWFDAETFDCVEHHEAAHKRGELGVAGVFQRVGISIEQESADVAAGDCRCFIDEFPTFVTDPRTTHARSLRALTRKQEREQPSTSRARDYEKVAPSSAVAFLHAVPEWRNGRRDGLKIRCLVRACGFDSHLGHHNDCEQEPFATRS